MKENYEGKIRVVTMLTQLEKTKLQALAWHTGRSMTGYLRHLVLKDIEDNYDDVRRTNRR